MRRPRGGWVAVAGPLASAVLFALYARASAAWPLGFVALLPWLLALQQTKTWRGALASAWLACVAFVAMVFGWFGVAIGDFTAIGSMPGVLVLLIGAPLLQPQFFALAFAHRLAARRGPWLRALAGACAWVACEWLVPKLLGDTLGHGLYPARLLRQGADLGGAAGLTLVLLLANLWLALAVARRGAGARAWAPPAIAALLLPGAMAMYGGWRLWQLDAEPPGVPLRVGMVQSNLVDYERLRRERGAYAVVREVLDTHYALSVDAVRGQRADVLLWSETVYPTTFAHPRSADAAALDAEIVRFAASTGVPLVFGTYDLDPAGEYNAAAFVDPRAGLTGFQRKTHPFPFTERVPPWLDRPWLRRLLPWTGTWQAGDGARVFPLRIADGRDVPAVALICLDDVQPAMGIDAARLGAQVLLGMSNDSWFTRHPLGMRLHRDVAAFRSIETRLPQFRVTANGMTAAIDTRGDVIASLAPGTRGVLVAETPVREREPTLLVRWGDWIGPAALAVLAWLALLQATRRWAPSGTAAAPSSYARGSTAVASALPPALRWLAAGLQLVARCVLLWMAAALLSGSDWLVNPIAKLHLFASLVLAPEAAAWAIARAYRTRIRFGDSGLMFDAGARHVDLAAGDVASVDAWAVPLPAPGLDLRLSDRRVAHGLAAIDPVALRAALASAGAALPRDGAYATALTRLSSARLAASRSRFEHPLLKFALFALVPALPAFRLHQHIAFGGTLGEWQTFGPQAWFTALLLWWGSWIANLALVAAVLRAGVEIATAATLALRPHAVAEVHLCLRRWARLAFYLGVPAWLAIRLWPW